MLTEEADRTIRNPIINAGDEGRDKREREAGKARYTSRRKLLKELLESEGDRVWVVRT